MRRKKKKKIAETTEAVVEPLKPLVKSAGDLPMNAKTLRALAFTWMRYEQSGIMVTFERSPYSSRILPDVLGLDKRRLLTEIEIKISKADFDKDMKKKHRTHLLEEIAKFRPRAPNFLYYLVPPKLVNHVLENAPSFAGVLTVDARMDTYSGLPTLTILRKAVRLHDQRLSIKNSIVMARDMSGTMASLLRDDVKNIIKKSKLESQVVALGGVLDTGRKKKKKPKPEKKSGKRSSK